MIYLLMKARPQVVVGSCFILRWLNAAPGTASKLTRAYRLHSKPVQSSSCIKIGLGARRCCVFRWPRRRRQLLVDFQLSEGSKELKVLLRTLLCRLGLNDTGWRVDELRWPRISSGKCSSGQGLCYRTFIA